MDGQKLMLLHARRLARQGNTSEIHALLETDLRFWRMTLESSDTLISRMIATGALTRHFEWGNLLLRELPAGSAADAIPDNWRVPLSDAELSILRCMTGEWIFFFPGASRPLRAQRAKTNARRSIARGRIWAGLFYEPQDTINRSAEGYLRIVALSMCRSNNMRRRELGEMMSEPVKSHSVYNLTGRPFSRMTGDFGTYVRRVGDIEGVRRAALLTVNLRDSNTPVSSVPAALAASPLRNPYDGQAFVWDEYASTLSSRGWKKTSSAGTSVAY